MKRQHTWTGKRIKCNVLYTRAGIATQVILKDLENETHLLFDCGDGTTRDILDAKIDLHKIKAIFISHGHPDHVGGLFSLLSTLRLFKVKTPITIHAPLGCKEAHLLTNLFLSLYKEGLRFNLSYKEINNDKDYNINNFIIKPFNAFHYETTKELDKPKIVKPAFGYKITLADEIIVYSGDTLANNRLEEEVRGASLALIEATYDKYFKEKDPNHLDYAYALDIAKKAKEHILIHRF